MSGTRIVPERILPVGGGPPVRVQPVQVFSTVSEFISWVRGYVRKEGERYPRSAIEVADLDRLGLRGSTDLRAYLRKQDVHYLPLVYRGTR